MNDITEQTTNFERLVIKLSQLSDFCFVPEGKALETRTNEDKKEEDEEIKGYWEEIEASQEVLQFKKGKGYDYLFPERKEAFNTSPYFRLYRYLHTEKNEPRPKGRFRFHYDNLFAEFQKKDGRFTWALFAYVGQESNFLDNSVKYLFGPRDTIYRDVYDPHFLFRTYEIRSKGFQTQPFDQIDNIAKIAYHARRNVSKSNDVDFVFVLRSYRKRTDFEVDNDLLYVPSGEMDGCILQWLLLMPEANPLQENLNTKVTFSLSHIRDGLTEEHGAIRFPDQNISAQHLLEWLHRWGIIKLKVRKQQLDFESSSFDVLPRALAMLHWVQQYLLALTCSGDEKCAPRVLETVKREKYYYRILSQPRDFEYGKETQISAEDNRYFEPQVLCNNGSRTKAWLEELKFLTSDVLANGKLAYNSFKSLLRLMVSWREVRPESGKEPWETFQRRCRFSPLIHYVARFNISYFEPTGLLAFPVLWEINDVEEKKVRQPVGVFMSVIQEAMPDEDGNLLKSAFKDFDKLGEGEGNTFLQRIQRIRTIINILAKVENVEVYQKGIRTAQIQAEEALKSRNNINYATHTIKTSMQVGLLPQAQSIYHKTHRLSKRIKELENSRLEIQSEIKDILESHLSYIKEVESLVDNAEIVNIISKVTTEISQKSHDDRILDLLKDKMKWIQLASDEFEKPLIISDVFNKVVQQNNEAGSKTKIALVSKPVMIPDDAILFGKYKLTEKFFRHLCMTAFENFYNHSGADQWQGKEPLCIDIGYKDGCLIFSNKILIERKDEEIVLTGNLATYNVVLSQICFCAKLTSEIKDSIYLLTINFNKNP